MKTWMDLEWNKVRPTYQRHEQAEANTCRTLFKTFLRLG